MMIHARPQPPEQALLFALCESHLKSIQEVHIPALEILVASGFPIRLELGEMLEDAANGFLDIAEQISERHLASRQAEPSSPAETRSVHPAAD
jgi:hypothetical protein